MVKICTIWNSFDFRQLSSFSSFYLNMNWYDLFAKGRKPYKGICEVVCRTRTCTLGEMWWVRWRDQQDKSCFCLWSQHWPILHTLRGFKDSMTVSSLTGDIMDFQKKSHTEAARRDTNSPSIAIPMTEMSTTANLPAPPATTQVDMTDNVCYGATKHSPRHSHSSSFPLKGSPKRIATSITEDVVYAEIATPPKISECDLVENVCYGMGPTPDAEPEYATVSHLNWDSCTPFVLFEPFSKLNMNVGVLLFFFPFFVILFVVEILKIKELFPPSHSLSLSLSLNLYPLSFALSLSLHQ